MFLNSIGSIQGHPCTEPMKLKNMRFENRAFILFLFFRIVGGPSVQRLQQIFVFLILAMFSVWEFYLFIYLKEQLEILTFSYNWHVSDYPGVNQSWWGTPGPPFVSYLNLTFWSGTTCALWLMPWELFGSCWILVWPSGLPKVFKLIYWVFYRIILNCWLTNVGGMFKWMQNRKYKWLLGK